ncbi:NAD(P)-dependent oxidoreductase [Pengzhenrongella sicca]|uniref:NAD(P)H-binding protein n=1 Tax=Pengzhenrongella sicca TaxID=2819238 RepID=A0A8A4ZGR4_9MICO|nr:NAD(P)H-binding protein [Pengzhenrongella sicca]QTE30143.1 NAD(P)H-binding protein [Pengzhenrongella sicca]
MARIVVLGGTGYTGSHLVRAAAARGHEVTSYSRTAPAAPVAGVRYETGSMTDEAERERAVAGADVVVAALAPRGALEHGLPGIYARLGELAADAGARFGVVGGFSSLRPADGAPRIAYGDDMPAEYAAEGLTMATVVDELISSAPASLDWFFVSPAATYGAHVPGEATGAYRTGTDTVLVDADGESAVSGADFAVAILDEIDRPAHHRAQFAVAY